MSAPSTRTRQQRRTAFASAIDAKVKSPLIMAFEERARDGAWVAMIARAAANFNGAPMRRDPVLTTAWLP